MPEALEAEMYRRTAATTIGRTIATVAVDETQRMAAEIRGALPGSTIEGVRRHGKLVIVDLGRVALGLHFGMTGRLIVDGSASIEQLEYASGRDDPKWDRFVVTFTDGGVLRVNDPRRWAVFTLDPDTSRLGPDVFDVTVAHLAARAGRRSSALKAMLLDQSVVAGYGNLLVDEILWQAGVSPVMPARTVSIATWDRIVATSKEQLPALLARGGSHRGTIDPQVRTAMPPCPRDGAVMRREQVGGRTTVWCPVHQTGADAAD
jgi:formamidopyrimidine-DNA glycosylase